MSRTKRWLSVLMALVLTLSLGVSAFAADPNGNESAQSHKVLDTRTAQTSLRNSGKYKAADQVHVILIMESKPLADNQGIWDNTFNTENKLLREQAKVRRAMDNANVSYKLNYSYTELLNGMSVTTAYGNVEKIETLPGVADVVVCREYSAPVLTPSADSASDMINASAMSQYLGADGSGKVIAVLDTGITVKHEAFQEYDGMLQTPAYDEAAMRSKIVDLGHGDYCNQKVPFQYDYADGDNDALDEGSGHGSHVAGIAAGYAATPEGEVTFHGSAPDAQILAMKIFQSAASTTSSDIYFAALEDAYKLGADVINMSIGAPNGFVEDDESVLNDRIYERLRAAGIICCISAGNESTIGEYSQNWMADYGYQFVKADNSDYGVLGSPASYNGNVAVAAVENLKYPVNVISVDGKQYPYSDTNGGAFLNAFVGQDLEYVVVPGAGLKEDYQDIDVKGKIALVVRGGAGIIDEETGEEITVYFTDKIANATEAGAAGIIIYNNADDGLINMAVDADSIPAIFIERDAGEAMKAAETKTLHVDDEQVVEQNPDAWSVASFSSWGPTNDLQIKPTISGVGGHVNSALAGTENGYEVQSGTSMSAPNVTGGYAALLEAIYDAYPGIEKALAAELVRNRTLSHAQVLPADILWDENDQPVMTEDGHYIYVPYSPRQQGAGLMDIASAYLAVLDIENPLVELGDDPSMSGVYTIPVDLVNTSDEEQTFDVSVDVITDQPTGANFGTASAPDYHFYNTLSPMLLEEGVDYTLDAPEKVTLAAGESKTVNVTITLTADALDVLDFYFENGFFVEGYVYFDGENDSAHATFMTFCGDWEAAPIIETADWRDQLQGYEPEVDTEPTVAYLVDANHDPYLYAGDNMFDFPEDGEFSDARIAVSPNTSATILNTLLVVPTINRNARHIIMIAHDSESGEIYYVDDTPFCPKTIFDAENGVFDHYAWFMFGGIKNYGKEMAILDDDTNVTLSFYANLPGGEDVLGSMSPEQILADGDAYLQYEIPCVVDGLAPEVTVAEDAYNPETGEVTVTVTDNQYVMTVLAIDENGDIIAAAKEAADAEEPAEAEEAVATFAAESAGETHEVTLYVGDQISFTIAALDYATNETDVEIQVPHQHELTHVEAVAPKCDENGSEEYWECELCGETFADENAETPVDPDDLTIEMTGHKLQKVDAVEATCEADGNIAYWECQDCHKCYIVKDGMTEVKAEETVVPALGHDWGEWEQTTAPTCTDAGEETRVCANDPSHVEKRPVEAQGHKLVKTEAVAPTCEAAGNIAYWTCSECGKLFSDEAGTTEITQNDTVLAALGHDWDEGKVTKEPTVDAEGVKTFTCKHDPSHTKTEAIAKLEPAPVPEKCDGGDNCPSKVFTDVDRSANSWYHEAVDWAYVNEVTDGVDDTHFAPGATCTRAQAVTFLWRANNSPEPKSTDNPFKDVAADAYYFKAVLWAVENNITDGTSDTTFSPDVTCSRAHIVTFLFRAAKGEAGKDNPFKDVPAGEWYTEPVLWAVANGITDGVDDTHFAPTSDCTRAHIVTFLYRAVEK